MFLEALTGLSPRPRVSASPRPSSRRSQVAKRGGYKSFCHFLAPEEGEVRVVHGAGGARGRGGGVLDRLLVETAAGERGFSGGQPDRRGGHAAQDQPGIRRDAVLETNRGPDAEHREIERPAAAQLAVARPPPVGPRHTDL